MSHTPNSSEPIDLDMIGLHLDYTIMMERATAGEKYVEDTRGSFAEEIGEVLDKKEQL